jgi:Viral coat protein P2 N-terminal domain
MGVKRRIRLPGFNGRAASQTATLDLPVGARYHEIWLYGDSATGKVATDHINEIRIKVNGKVQRTMTYTELQALNVFNGSIYGIVGNTTAGTWELPIFFAEPWRKDPRQQDGLAWATGDLSSFQIEVDIKADNPDSLYANAVVDNSLVTINGGQVDAPMGLINKWFRTAIPYVGTSIDYQQFPVRDAYQQISFFDPSSDIDRVTVKVDNNVIHDLTKDENDAILKAHGMTPVAGRYDLVFDHDDALNSALPMSFNGRRVSNFQVKIESDTQTARNITALYQLLGYAE